MQPVFVAIYFPPESLTQAGFDGRDEIEDPLDEALQHASLGEVTGGGSGIRGSNIDIEIEDDARFNEGLSLIRQVLRNLKVPRTAYIKRYEPSEIVYNIYE